MTTCINFQDYTGSDGSGSQTDAISENGLSATRNSTSKKLRIQHTGLDEFRPGAIVKLKLINFVTYALTEFHLAPSLNMIMGPNGSGKSTFVCAVCLGLAGRPELIGRAKKVSEYIRNGTDQASIEITLKNSDQLNSEVFPMINVDDEIVHIKRVIHSGRRRSDYYLNNRAVDEDVIKALVAVLNIQLDNLCQFLSQERVQEFARLKSDALLNETIRAIEVGLLHKFTKLKNLQAEGDEKRKELESNENRLHQLSAQKEKLEAQVQQVNLYKEKLNQLQLHEKLINYTYVKEHNVRIKSLKHRCKAMDGELKSMQKEMQPYLNAGASLSKEQEDCEKLLERLNRSRYSNVASFNSTRETLSSLSKRVNDCNQRISYLKTRNKSIKDEIKSCEEKVKQLEDEKRQVVLPAEGMVEELTERSNQLKARRGEVSEEMVGIKSKLTEMVHNSRHLEQALKSKQKDLTSNDRLFLLDKFSSHGNTVFFEMKKAIQYLRSLNGVAGKIFEPPILAVSAVNNKYAAYLTACVDFHTSMSLTMLNKHVYEEYSGDIVSKFRVNIREISGQPIEPPMSREELSRYGFEGYLVDFVRGEEEVIRMLCQQQKIHMIPVTTQLLSANHLEVLKTPDSNGRIRFPKFIEGNSIHTIRQSEYGSRQIYSSSGSIDFSTEYYRGSTMSTEEAASIRYSISELKQNLSDLKANYANTMKVKEEKEVEYNSLTHKLDHLNTQSAELTKGNRLLDNFNMRIERYKQKIATNTEKLRVDTTQSFSAAKEKLQATYEEERTALLNLPELTKEIQQIDIDIATATMNLLNTTIKVDSLSQICRTMQMERKQKEEEHMALLEEYKAKKNTEEYVQWNSIIRNLSQEEKATLNDIATEYDAEDKFNSEYVESVINRLSSELSIMNNDASVIELLNKTTDDIISLENRIPTQKAQLANILRGVIEIKDELEPKFDRIVAQISEKFSKLFVNVGSAGEVQLIKPAKFVDWGIEIRVKFRDNSELQQLNPHSQSGGERAASTVLYMIALQQFTTSPFRVVDEINQGMDQANERVVHKIMVENACAEDTSQYFLITPKLLTNLYYHDRMRIHCVFAGSWIPNPAADPEKTHFGETSSYVL